MNALDLRVEDHCFWDGSAAIRYVALYVFRKPQLIKLLYIKEVGKCLWVVLELYQLL